MGPLAASPLPLQNNSNKKSLVVHALIISAMLAVRTVHKKPFLPTESTSAVPEHTESKWRCTIAGRQEEIQ